MVKKKGYVDLKKLLASASVAISVVVLVILLAWSQANSLGSRIGAQTTNFIQVSGKNLVYNGQSVTLKGTNFNNLEALNAEWGEGSGQWIGGANSNIGEIKINEADYQLLSQLGANHVRFGMSFSWWRDNRAEFFRVMDQHVQWARQNDLWMVLNLFTTPGDCYEGYSAYCDLYINSGEQEQLRAFWRDVAAHYANEPVIAGYDLINEPVSRAEAGWGSGWKNLAQTVVDVIREVDQNHTIFYMTTPDQSFSNGKLNDNNVVYQIHDYAPLAMSHCGTTPGRITYPGNAQGVYWDLDSQLNGRALKDRLPAIEWAAANNLPLYIGEWGAQGDCLTGREQYTADKATIYNAWGLHHAHFVWQGSSRHWGLFPEDSSTPHSSAMLAAVRTSWTGSVSPNFSGTAPEYPPVGTLPTGSGVPVVPVPSGAGPLEPGTPAVTTPSDTAGEVVGDCADEHISTAIGCVPLADVPEIARFFLQWALGTAGGIGIFLIAFAAYRISTSQGDPRKLQGGQELLLSAIGGLVMLVLSVFLLRFVGVNLLGLF